MTTALFAPSLAFVLAPLVVMAVSGAVATNAPRTLVRTTAAAQRTPRRVEP